MTLVLWLNFRPQEKNSTVIAFNQKSHWGGMKALNMSGNHWEPGNNPFNYELHLCKWYPYWGQWAEALCLVARQQGTCYSKAHQYQHGALTKPHSWFHLRDGCMEMLDKGRRLCNVEKVRVGTVPWGFIFEVGVIQCAGSSVHGGFCLNFRCWCNHAISQAKPRP